MNTSEKQGTLHLSEPTYQESVAVGSLFQKIVEKKRFILRKAFFFFLGLSLYLVSSFL